MDLVRFSDLLSRGSRFPRQLFRSVPSFASSAIKQVSVGEEIEPDSSQPARQKERVVVLANAINVGVRESRHAVAQDICSQV